MSTRPVQCPTFKGIRLELAENDSLTKVPKVGAYSSKSGLCAFKAYPAGFGTTSRPFLSISVLALPLPGAFKTRVRSGEEIDEADAANSGVLV